MELKIEKKAQKDTTASFQTEKTHFLMTPLINEDYWKYRVCLSEEQAVIAFPKFGTRGRLEYKSSLHL
jgi:hypothetical protein